MRIIRYTRDTELNIEEKTVVALGFFDGVHAGHRILIRSAVNAARELGLTPAVFTFSPGDNIKSDSPRIYPEDEKMKILESLGVKIVISADFGSIKDMPREEFVDSFLIKSAGCQIAVAGMDFRFGSRALGDTAFLEGRMMSHGLAAIIVRMKEYEDDDGRLREISSTRIRDLLHLGRVKEAAILLGEPYHIGGKVLHGRKVGRQLGYPTVNICLPNNSPLASGVYETRVKIGEKLYTGLTNVGTCPSFEERERHTETFILDFEGDLYGDRIEIDFLDYVRGERAFSTPTDLIEEIARNIKQVREKENGR